MEPSPKLDSTSSFAPNSLAACEAMERPMGTELRNCLSVSSSPRGSVRGTAASQARMIRCVRAHSAAAMRGKQPLVPCGRDRDEFRLWDVGPRPLTRLGFAYRILSRRAWTAEHLCPITASGWLVSTSIAHTSFISRMNASRGVSPGSHLAEGNSKHRAKQPAFICRQIRTFLLCRPGRSKVDNLHPMSPEAIQGTPSDAGPHMTSGRSKKTPSGDDSGLCQNCRISIKPGRIS